MKKSIVLIIALLLHRSALFAQATASLSLTGNSQICSGGSTTASLTFTGVSPWSYTVSDGMQTINGTSPTSPVFINITPTTAGTHNYAISSFSDNNGQGITSGSALVNVVTNVPATPSTITGLAKVCPGVTGVSYSIPLLVNVLNYSWNPAPGMTINNGQGTNTVQISFNNNFVSGNLQVAGVNACGTGAFKSKSITNDLPARPGTISGLAKICPGATGVTYSITPMAGILNYTWSPSGSIALTGGQGTNSVTVNFPNPYTSGTVKVAAINSCGTGPFKSKTVSSDLPGTPGNISGPADVCPGATGVSYSIPLMVNVLNYSWQASNITINNGQGSNAINASIGSTFTSGSISVAGVNACGTGPMRKLTIKSRVPATPGAITGPTYNVCNSTANYSVPLVVGVYSYSWSPGNLVTNGQGTNNVQVTFPTGFTSSALTVTANTNLCTPGTSTPRALTIFGKPNTPSNITANPTSWCNGAPVSFSVASVSPPPVYSWTIPSGMTLQSGQGGNSINVLWGTGSGIVKVKASNNCGTSSYRSQTFSSTCREGEINTTQEQPIVYPNPASTILNIEFYSSIKESIPIRLLDVTGKEVLLQMVNANNGSNNISMDINKLARGVYFIEIKTNQQVFRKKVVFD